MMARSSALAAAATMAAGMVLAGCAGSHPTAPQRRAPQTARARGDVTALVRQLGACIHAHGAPSFPEPSLDAAGNVAFPADAPDLPPPAETACRSIIDQLPAPAASASSTIAPPVLQQWLAFAACMRRHGLPRWPDPQPDGSFALPASIRRLPSDAIAPAFEACRALSPNPDGKYSASGGGQ